MDDYIQDPLLLVDEIIGLVRSGVTLTAEQEMAAQELGINISELREFANVVEPFNEEAEEGYEDTDSYL